MARELLSSHPHVSLCRHETHFIPSFTRQLGLDARLGKSELTWFAAELRKTQLGRRAASYGESQYIPSDSLQAAAATSAGVPWTDVIEDVCRFFSMPHGREGRDESPIWGDKTPMYIRNLPLLLRLFPDSHIIGIVREVAAQTESEARHWRRSRVGAVGRWTRYNRSLLTEHARQPTRIHIVRYEDLTKDPSRAISDIERSVGLPARGTPATLRGISDELGLGIGQTKVVASQPAIRKLRRLEARSTRAVAEALGYLQVQNHSTTYPKEPTPPDTVERLFQLLSRLFVGVDAAGLVAYHIRQKGIRPGIAYFRSTLRERG